MKFSINRTKNSHHGKKWFFVALSCLIALAFATVLFTAPDVNECNKKLEQCGCPIDASYIGRKNIILIDASNPVPPPKLIDIQQLVRNFNASDSSIFTWLGKGKKVDQTSIYVLNSSAPVDMLPIASFCQLPPNLSFEYFSNFTGKQIEFIKQEMASAIAEAASSVSQYQSTQSSEIVKAVGAVLSSSTSWKDGSTFILVSDLYENSAACGMFPKAVIPAFENISPTCAHQIDIIKTYASNDDTTVAICPIHSKEMKDGLIPFWDDLFLSVNGRKPIYTCESEKILNRSNSIRTSK